MLERPVSVGGLIAAAIATVVLSIGASAGVAAVMDTPGPQGVAGQSIQGEKGDRGTRGLRGHRGRSGKTGAAGVNGANGTDGETIVEQACSNDVDVPLPYC